MPNAKVLVELEGVEVMSWMRPIYNFKAAE